MTRKRPLELERMSIAEIAAAARDGLISLLAAAHEVERRNRTREVGRTVVAKPVHT